LEMVIGLTQAVAEGVLLLVQISMLVRAVVSWFPGGEDSTVGLVAYAITEPIVTPVRRIIERFESVRNFPIDMSFFVTFLLVTMIAAVLFP